MSWRPPASLLAALALVAAGCGSTSGGGGGSEPPPATELEVSYWQSDTHDAPATATLTCDPVGGTHPRADAACAALAADPDALGPVAGDVACTQIYGGPETAEVTGSFRGEPVDARFNRTNGCEIDRWERLLPLLELA